MFEAAKQDKDDRSSRTGIAFGVHSRSITEYKYRYIDEEEGHHDEGKPNFPVFRCLPRCASRYSADHARVCEPGLASLEGIKHVCWSVIDTCDIDR